MAPFWFIPIAIALGCTVVVKPSTGRQDPGVEKYPSGYFVGPTIFDQVTLDMPIAKEKIFGPVAYIVRSEKSDDAIDIINEKKVRT